MSDKSYPVYQHYGTNAQRLAFTPSPPATGQPIYTWYETDTDNFYIYTTAWKGPYRTGVSSTAAATVSTDETQTNNTGYADLATSGPSVTITSVGTVAIVWISAGAYRTLSAGSTGLISPAVSGATTIAASDTNCAFGAAPTASGGTPLSRVLVMTITAGTNTYKLQYKNDNTGSGIWHFTNRSIAVFAP